MAKIIEGNSLLADSWKSLYRIPQACVIEGLIQIGERIGLCVFGPYRALACLQYLSFLLTAAKVIFPKRALGCLLPTSACLVPKHSPFFEPILPAVSLVSPATPCPIQVQSLFSPPFPTMMYLLLLGTPAPVFSGSLFVYFICLPIKLGLR